MCGRPWPSWAMRTPSCHSSLRHMLPRHGRTRAPRRGGRPLVSVDVLVFARVACASAYLIAYMMQNDLNYKVWYVTFVSLCSPSLATFTNLPLHHPPLPANMSRRQGRAERGRESRGHDR